MDRVRVLDQVEQRQVVDRIGIKITAGEIAAVFGQPGAQRIDLAFAISSDAEVAAGVALPRYLRLGRQQQRNSKHFRDRLGNETVGGTDDHQFVPAIAMLLEQALHAGAHQWFDPGFHVILAVPIQFTERVPGQGFQGELQVLVVVELAPLIIPIKSFVTRAIGLFVDQSAGNHVFPPEVVAVPVDQGMVEVEDGQSHDIAAGRCLLGSENLCQNGRPGFYTN